MPVQFARFTDAERALVEQIAARAVSDPGSPYPDQGTALMDLAAVHAHTPLRLQELAEADDFNFWHDMGGIAYHLDRTTGKLGGCFLPRFAAREG